MKSPISIPVGPAFLEGANGLWADDMRLMRLLVFIGGGTEVTGATESMINETKEGNRAEGVLLDDAS